MTKELYDLKTVISKKYNIDETKFQNDYDDLSGQNWLKYKDQNLQINLAFDSTPNNSNKKFKVSIKEYKEYDSIELI
jgi:hypothetical protein